jgi:hypothetical protein
VHQLKRKTFGVFVYLTTFMYLHTVYYYTQARQPLLLLKHLLSSKGRAYIFFNFTTLEIFTHMSGILDEARHDKTLEYILLIN